MKRTPTTIRRCGSDPKPANLSMLVSLILLNSACAGTPEAVEMPDPASVAL